MQRLKPNIQSKEKKDVKAPILSKLTSVLKEKDKENKDSVQERRKSDTKAVDNSRRKSDDKKSK